MQKNFLALIILLLVFSGCTEETKKMKEYEIKLESHEFSYETGKMSLQVYSGEEIQKARFELTNQEKESQCIEYANLKKGLNEISIKCAKINSNLLFLEITPSDGIKKEFEIIVPARKSIKLEKDSVLNFGLTIKDLVIQKNFNFDSLVFVTDENNEFIQGITQTTEKEGELKFFYRFLINKETMFFYFSEIKNTCKEVCRIPIENPSVSKNEVLFIIPFYFFILQDEKFNLEEFLKEKHYEEFVENKNEKLEMNITEETTFNGFKALKTEVLFENEKPVIYFIQKDSPHLVLYGESDLFRIQFKKTEKTNVLPECICSGD